MSFWPHRLAATLEASREALRLQQEQLSHDARLFDGALQQVERLGKLELEQRLEKVANPGALPSSEHDRVSGWFVPFGQRWESHEQARGWAQERIAGVTTAAVDGSEIRPSKDHTLPLGFVQVAWFCNPHDGAQRHEKDARIELVLPTPGQEDVSLRRFRLECQQLRMLVEDLAGRSPPPVLFFDGTFVLSFTNEMPQPQADRYVAEMVSLLQATEQFGVPVVGYTDTSEARDLVALTARAADVELPEIVRDAPMLSRRMAWGDRTKAFVCARNDRVLERYRGEDGRSLSREVCFVYLKTTSEFPPARLDVPGWLVRDGLLDHVVDVVRAEVIATAAGYPYAVEAADAAAVLALADRERVLRAVQRFCDGESLTLDIVPKAASKRRRRE